jgi:fructokinase
MKVLAFGEILFDIIEGKNYLGGAPLNYAAHLAKCSAEAYIYSRVGADDLGKQALSQVKEVGVNTQFVQSDNQHPTGTVEVVLENGHPDYTIFENVAWDYISLSEEQKAALTDFDVLYFGTLSQRHAQSKNTLWQLLNVNKYKHVFYDVNLRKGFYSKEILHTSLQMCTILKLNDDEVGVLAELFYSQALEIEAFAQKVSADYSINTIIITAGDKGCYIYEGQQLHFVKGYSVEVVDTVGAGDAFSAAFTYHYFHTNDPLHAADVANRLGAFVASSRGPIPTYSPEIKQLLALK